MSNDSLVLITGGAGFIGSHVADRLLECGYRVRALDSLDAQVHGEGAALFPQYLSTEVEALHGDVRNPRDVSAALDGVEAVFHFASAVGVGQSMYEIDRYARVNIGGTALMLHLLSNRKHSVAKVVVASSRAVYGEGKYQSRVAGIVYPEARREADLKSGRFEPVCDRTGEPLQLLATDEDSKLHPTSVYGITKQNQEQMVMVVCK